MNKEELAEAEKFFDELCKTFGTGKYRPGWVEKDAPETKEIVILDGIQQNLVIGTQVHEI